MLKPVCFTFDLAPTRALGQLSGMLFLPPNEPNRENTVRDLVSFRPVPAYDEANMPQIEAGVPSIAAWLEPRRPCSRA